MIEKLNLRFLFEEKAPKHALRPACIVTSEGRTVATPLLGSHKIRCLNALITKLGQAGNAFLTAASPTQQR